MSLRLILSYGIIFQDSRVIRKPILHLCTFFLKIRWCCHYIWFFRLILNINIIIRLFSVFFRPKRVIFCARSLRQRGGICPWFRLRYRALVLEVSWGVYRWVQHRLLKVGLCIQFIAFWSFQNFPRPRHHETPFLQSWNALVCHHCLVHHFENFELELLVVLQESKIAAGVRGRLFWGQARLIGQSRRFFSLIVLLWWKLCLWSLVLIQPQLTKLIPNRINHVFQRVRDHHLHLER